jgi:hypothetical protein
MLKIDALHINSGTKVQCLRPCVNAELLKCQRNRITIGDNGACVFFSPKPQEGESNDDETGTAGTSTTTG